LIWLAIEKRFSSSYLSRAIAVATTYLSLSAKVIDRCYAASVTPPSSCHPSSQDIMPRVTLVDFSADEHDVVGRTGFKDLLVCARRVGEWQFLANDGAQGAVFEPGKNPGVDVPPLQSV
jgi:hypothetical protein